MIRASVMRHIPYPKIYAKLPNQITSHQEWVATEKVHGANLVIATDGEAVYFGKRKAWLEDSDVFFGWQLIRAHLHRAILMIQRRYPKQEVRLFGELYGGHYPHPQVEPTPGLSAVQTGIWYAPDLHFMPFDMLVSDKSDDESDDESYFVDFDELSAVCAEAGLSTPPVLARGSLSEVCQAPTRFASRVSREHDLPVLPDNYAEGLVIKPVAGSTIEAREIVKHKIMEFDDARFGEARAFNAQQHLTSDELIQIGTQLINPPRLASAQSKLGQVSPQALIDEVLLDVLIDLSEAYLFAMSAVDERLLSETLRPQIERSVKFLLRSP